MSASLLIVDDDKLTRDTLADALADDYRTYTAANGAAALSMLQAGDFDVVLSDLMMPGLSGLELMEKISQLPNRPEVIFITGHATVESAVEAMKLGAADYITKPVRLDRLCMLLQKTLETRRLREENTRLKSRIREDNARVGLVGASPVLMKALDHARQVADTDASVLIEGESGTGKEAIANFIHYQSHRCAAPFIKVNCAAFAEGLLESELFGHERGAFTGAVATKKGRFELADGGTLFLDEVGDLPAAAQVKLLRFLQEKAFERVGGNKTYKVDVRIVAATNRNLRDLVRDGAFREDLYYRLRVVSILAPPLRERNEDIDPLVRHFLRHFGDIHSRPVVAITNEALTAIKAHAWPGNVRELMHCVESMVVMARGDTLTPADLPEYLVFDEASGPPANADSGIMAQMERQAIADALRQTNGNKVEAARLLGIGLRTLYRKIDKWRL